MASIVPLGIIARIPKVTVTAFLIVALLAVTQVAIAHTFSSGLADSPAIVLPDGLLTSGQPANTPIDIAFVTAPDTTVDLSSVHVWVHNFFWIDVTDRLLSHREVVHLHPHGIHLDGGVLPAGEYQVRLSFHDMKGRLVEATQTIHILRS